MGRRKFKIVEYTYDKGRYMIVDGSGAVWGVDLTKKQALFSVKKMREAQRYSTKKKQKRR